MLSLASLLVIEGRQKIYQTALDIASAVGLPVTSWQAGDPTRSLYHLEAEKLSALELVARGFIASGFLDYAEGEWLKIVAWQGFRVEVPEATYAATDEVLTNNGGGFYEIEPGDLTFKNTATGKTYRNTTGGTLASGPGTTLTVSIEAGEPGSVGSAAAGEIAELVTTLLGVTCTNPTAALGLDEQDADTTRAQCRRKLSMLSPNGPSGAAAFVALTRSLTGANGVTRVRVYGSSDTGDVKMYLAGPSGGVSEVDRAKVEAAVVRYATPLCITPHVYSGAKIALDVTYDLWVYTTVNETEDEIEADVVDALEVMFSEREIGGDFPDEAAQFGIIAHSLIEGTIKQTFPADAFKVVVSSPESDVTLQEGWVAALGVVTPRIHLVVRK